jgi:hypothetical protein
MRVSDIKVHTGNTYDPGCGGHTTNHALSNYSAETMTILVLACAINDNCFLSDLAPMGVLRADQPFEFSAGD